MKQYVERGPVRQVNPRRYIRAAILYGTDFDGLSPGGIQNFVFQIGLEAPADIHVTYIGLGLAARLPRNVDDFISLGPKGRGPINLQYTAALKRNRDLLQRFDVLGIHRAEHMTSIPKGVRAVLTLHGGTWNALRALSPIGIPYPAMEAYAIRKATRVLSVNPSSTWLPARGLGKPLEAIRTPASDAFNVRSPPLLRHGKLVTACRLVPEKRVHKLVELAALSESELVVFGDGPMRARLQARSKALDARVVFRGAVDSEAIAREYREGGVFCLSSRFEGYPLAAVEALAAGLPVVGVGTTCVAMLGEFGARTTSSVTEAAELLHSGSLRPPDVNEVWATHSPQAIGESYWSSIRDTLA